jgi:hypothetical protein
MLATFRDAPLHDRSLLERAINRDAMTDQDARSDAAAALEVAECLRGRPAVFEDWAADWGADEWMLDLPFELARSGDVDDAVRVTDAFAELDRDDHPT